MADQEPQPTRAEQRMMAVAKLKRATSVPRLKDGRRPPMHIEAVSEGEKPVVNGVASEEVEEEVREVQISYSEAEKLASDTEQGQPDDDKNLDPDRPPPEENTPEAEMEVEVEEERPFSPGLNTRSKRRSRSRSRSRGSKDFKGKARGAQSPVQQVAGDSSPDEGPPILHPIALPMLTPLLSPIPSHFALLQQSRLLRSPTPASPEPSLFYPGTSPPTPIPLPTLEALQRGLIRSNSAGSTAAGRRMAMHKLTGGTETYDSSPPPTPPPLPGKLGRNNTVAGGERIAARQLMFSRLGGRLNKDFEEQQTSGAEDRTAPSPTPRRRRRSRRTSASVNTANAQVSDSDPVTTSPNTPLVPQTPLPLPLEAFANLRAQSATPNQASSSRNQSNERAVEPPPSLPHTEPETEPPEPRRRSVLVEEEDDIEDRIPSLPLPVNNSLPSTPPQWYSPHIASLRTPQFSNPPSNGSSDSVSGTGVLPVYLSQRSPSRNGPFPTSPFTTPLKEEKPAGDEDEEQVLYPAESRPRTPYVSNVEFDREISWVASPVPEIRMPIDDKEDDEEGEEVEVHQEDPDDQYVEYEDPPLSASSSAGFSPQDAEAFDDISPRVSTSSKSIVVESETSLDAIPPHHIPTSPSLAALSQTASFTLASDVSMSPQTYPARLSIASRIQSDRSPLNGDFTDWEDRFPSAEPSTKRNGESSSPSTWDKLKSTFTRTGSSSGRRSRTNSIVTRERRDHTDSSISRESGASLNSGRTDKGETILFQHQPQQQPLMQSPSASASILSLSHAPPRGGASPIPPVASGDMSKYQNAKLFPFPGMKQLQEQRRKGGYPASASSPDVSMTYGGQEDVQTLPPTSHSLTLNSSLNPESGELSSLGSGPPSASHTDVFTISPISPQNGSSLNLKLPMTLPGVKQWLSKNNKKKTVPHQSLSPSASASFSPPPIELQNSFNSNKKASLTDLLRVKETELGTDWEDIGITPTSTKSNTLLGKRLNGPEVKERVQEAPSVNGTPYHTDTEKTPKAKKIMPPPFAMSSEPRHLSPDDQPPPSTSRSERPVSGTPYPSSSLSDYPNHSTSESESTSSSSLSHPSQGSAVLERLEENLTRGSRNPMLVNVVDDPPRKLLLSSPVLQVVDPNTVKDRFLFLFSDILVIAKPVSHDQDNFMDAYKPSPPDRKYVVKSVVLLRNIRFFPDRTESQSRTGNNSPVPRNPLVRSFVLNFSKDPDYAITTLFSKSNIPDDPQLLGQLLFKTIDLDRARLGDYLSRRTSKIVLKTYLDSFGFAGLRIDIALKVFLQSLHVSPKSTQSHGASEYLLDFFAVRWYEANAKSVAYDKDMAIRLVRGLVQLNDLLHDGIADEAGRSDDVKRNITSRDFVDAFRRTDVRCLVSDEFLEDVYDSIRSERLCQARYPSPTSSADLQVTIKRQLPARLTYKIQSDPIIFRIPHVDPFFSIQLYGQDLVFDPPVLTFAKSSEASFRVMGTSLGSKTVTLCRSGPNAVNYAGLPISHTVVVERAFMRNTFQLAFSNHTGTKRRYMFSVDDPLIRHQWAVSLKRQIDNATAAAELSTRSSTPVASTFLQAAESVAFKVLQEILIGTSISSNPPSSKGPLHRHNVSSQSSHGSVNGGLTVDHRGSPQSLAALVRSKSRSKVYHRHGAGKNELDLTNNAKSRNPLENGGGDLFENSVVYDQSVRIEGNVWSGRDLQMQCQQNSSIPLVLAFLRVDSQEHVTP